MVSLSNSQDIFILPGRIRVKINGLYRNRNLGIRLETLLKKVHGVFEASANWRTGRVLIRFNPEVCSYEELVSIARNYETLTTRHDCIEFEETTHITEPEDLPIKNQVLNTVIPASILLMLLLQKVSGKPKREVHPHVFNVGTVTALVSTYPFLRSGFQHIAAKGKINHDLILSSLTLSILFLREGILGLSVILLSNLTSLIQTLALKKSAAKFPGHKVCRLDKNSLVDQQMVDERAQKLAYTSLGASAFTYAVTRDWQRVLSMLLAANPSSVSTSHTIASEVAVSKAVENGIYVADSQDLINIGRTKDFILEFDSDSINDNYQEVVSLINSLRLIAKDITIFSDEGARVLAAELKVAFYSEWAALKEAKEKRGGFTTIITSHPSKTFDLAGSIVITIGKDVNCPTDVYISDFNKVNETLRIANAAERTASQNERVSLLFNIAGLMLGGINLLSPLKASILPNISSLVTLFNSYISVADVNKKPVKVIKKLNPFVGGV